MAKPVILLYEQIHEDALAILEEKAEIRWPAPVLSPPVPAHNRVERE
jgi:hypothetical protein